MTENVLGSTSSGEITATSEKPLSQDHALLHCPIRGKLNAAALAKDNLTPTEEARRIDFLNYLLGRGYPKQNIAVETVVLKGLGESGRNKLRADVIVYDVSLANIHALEEKKRLNRALLVAEIKRDSAKKKSGITSQLEPAMRQLPGMKVLGAYWDDVNRILFTKELVKRNGDELLEIRQDALANLPAFGTPYKHKPITVDTLTAPENLVGMLYNIANIMRSHGVNDEQLRYKETVKLLLARYVDEKAARASSTGELALQVYQGPDPRFTERVREVYAISARRYSRAHSLFKPVSNSELDEATQKDMVRLVQGIDLSSASNETMQHVFMSFVPTVFKKSLDQYFTPLTLIETMVAITNIGPNDKVADPAMGTADFLTTAMAYCTERGDSDIVQRVFGIDSDRKAYDLAVINMILNKDGQANLLHEDSIAQPDLWKEEMDVALCNPPFGARTLENRHEVLKHYDLGHVWEYDESEDKWVMTDQIQEKQQLGILFIERCYKLLSGGGRLAIILPEGYLSTEGYGYVRQWIVEHLQILSLVELPRRIFVRADADLRSNILLAKRSSSEELKLAKLNNYPIHADLVRRVGYKLGTGFQPIPLRDEETGLEVRDNNNNLILDSDFNRVRLGFDKFSKAILHGSRDNWTGAAISDISAHPNLDMKPRRLVPKALENLRNLKSGNYVRLGDVAEVVEDTIDLISEVGPSKMRRLVEGQDIRAVEGIVAPQEPTRCWTIAERKSSKCYSLTYRDVVVGLVRPERRNIGLLLSKGADIVGSPDGIAIVREKASTAADYPPEWIFSVLRSETCRLQFWTESGGTSYGKLTRDQIRNVLLPMPTADEVRSVKETVGAWATFTEQSLVQWEKIGTEADRKIILNSAIHGLETDLENLY